MDWKQEQAESLIEALSIQITRVTLGLSLGTSDGNHQSTKSLYHHDPLDAGLHKV